MGKKHSSGLAIDVRGKDAVNGRFPMPAIKSVCQRLGGSFDSPGKEDGDLAEEFRRRRKKQSIPTLSAIGDWLHGPECSTALPKSPFGEAAGYCLDNWQALTEYARHGHLSIDNDAAEQNSDPSPWDGRAS